MSIFARAVETGSFSAVARERGIGQPNVSRHVAALEQHLRTRLLYRSTRKLTLTPEGERYYADARRVLDAVEEAESNARGEDKPIGLLRVACPTILGRSRILPRIRTLLERFPGIDLDLQIGDRFIDLIEEGVDVAIRIGLLDDSNLRARRVGTSERVCVASPEYLALHGVPLRPEELSRHNCIVYSLARSGSIWPFRAAEVAVNGRLKVNTPDGIYVLC
jgi:DNA-binding transcriptional LysR family regulator